MTKQTGSILVWAGLIVAALLLVGCGGGDVQTDASESNVVIAVHNPQVRP